jgi:hypothetical protein
VLTLPLESVISPYTNFPSSVGLLIVPSFLTSFTTGWPGLFETDLYPTKVPSSPKISLPSNLSKVLTFPEESVISPYTNFPSEARVRYSPSFRTSFTIGWPTLTVTLPFPVKTPPSSSTHLPVRNSPNAPLLHTVP